MRWLRISVPTAVRWLVLSLVLLTGLALTRRLLAADPQPYTVALQPTGNTALDSALKDSSSLISLQKSAPVAGFALTGRARQDETRFQTALRSFGYYKATVSTTIGGHDLNDPALPAIVDAAPAKPALAIAITFALGPRFKLGSVTISTPVPPDIPPLLDLKPGQPAMAADVLAARGRLEKALLADGYPLAKVPEPVAILHLDQNLLDVDFQPVAGPKATIGPITLNGSKGVNTSFIRRRLLLQQGEPFNPQTIEKARQDLMATGVFSGVRAVPAPALDSGGQLPIAIDLTERPQHSVDVGAGYSTDLGVNFNAGWHDRNLFGNAEQLNLTAAEQLGGDAVTRPGYAVGAQFLKPDFMMRDQTLELDLNAIDQSLQAYNQKALLQKIAFNRQLTPQWTASAGLTGEQESIYQENATRGYSLVGLPVSLKYDSTTSLLDPTNGIRASLSVTPSESLGTTDSTFFVTQVSGSTYIDVFSNGRSILALRGIVGQISGAGVFGLPPDQRFYAGGSATVRGYRYQTLGPQFRDGIPIGGTAISAGTVEWRQRILDNYGVVGFIDDGQVSSNGIPFASQFHAGAGIGARYYTSIGPIRLDFAVPVNKLPGGDAFEVYIGIGQAF